MDVVVIGSVNRDVSVMAPWLPRPGESVTGTEHFYGPGGKGANQAVAAARLGASVGMVGRVGDDDHGKSLVEGLQAAGVDVTAVGVDEEAGTGIAIITIDENAENTIVISPGANMQLGAAHVESHGELISGANVVVAQLEIPVGAVLAAARAATGLFCLNPAPARPIPNELLELTDVLIPNRSELAILASIDEPTTVESAVAAASSLRRDGPTIVTLGADGAVLVDGNDRAVVPAPDVDAIDPTGAGDAFCGAFAYFVSTGDSLERAVHKAVAAGAVAVTRRGAQAAMPTLEEVEAMLAG